MAKNTKMSSHDVARLASKTLSDSNASTTARQLAGSVLSQSGTKRETGAAMESKASHVLRSSKYSDDTKTLAASALSQSNRKR